MFIYHFRSLQIVMQIYIYQGQGEKCCRASLDSAKCIWLWTLFVVISHLKQQEKCVQLLKKKKTLFFSSEILFWIVCDRLVCKTLIQCRVNFGGKLTTTGKINSALHLTCYDFSLEVMDCSSALLLSAPHSIPHYVNFFLDISMDLFSINMFEECQLAHVWAHRHTQPLQWKLLTV